MQYLRFARPSAWSDSVRVASERATADVFAGPTGQSKKPRSFNKGSGSVEFNEVEPYIDVVVSSWDADLGAKLPSKQRVFVGETLDFNAPAFLTHPISWTVLVGEDLKAGGEPEDIDKFILPFRTGTTVVDAFLGDTMVLPIEKRLTMQTPTEVLMMDANGKMKVSNQFDAATAYRNEITEKDASRAFGKLRRQKKSKDDDDGGADFDESDL